MAKRSPGQRQGTPLDAELALDVLELQATAQAESAAGANASWVSMRILSDIGPATVAPVLPAAVPRW